MEVLRTLAGCGLVILGLLAAAVVWDFLHDI